MQWVADRWQRRLTLRQGLTFTVRDSMFSVSESDWYRMTRGFKSHLSSWWVLRPPENTLHSVNFNVNQKEAPSFSHKFPFWTFFQSNRYQLHLNPVEPWHRSSLATLPSYLNLHSDLVSKVIFADVWTRIIRSFSLSSLPPRTDLFLSLSPLFSCFYSIDVVPVRACCLTLSRCSGVLHTPFNSVFFLGIISLGFLGFKNPTGSNPFSQVLPFMLQTYVRALVNSLLTHATAVLL